eukprot:gene7265-377_t
MGELQKLLDQVFEDDPGDDVEEHNTDPDLMRNAIEDDAASRKADRADKLVAGRQETQQPGTSKTYNYSYKRFEANKIKKKDQRDCPERVVLHLKALAHTLLTDIAYSTVVNPLESENDPILLYMMKQPEFATAFEDGVIKPLVNTLQHIRSNKQIKTYGISSQPLDCPSRPYREHSRGAAVLVEYKLPPVKELDPSDPSTLKEFSLPEDFFNGLSVKSAWDKYNKALLVGGVWMSMSELDALWEAQGMGKTWYSGLNSRRKEVSDLAGCITSYTKYMGVHKTEEESLAEFFKWTQDKGMVSLSQWNMRMRGSVKANVLASLAQGILPKDLLTQDDLKATKKRKLEDDVIKEDAHRETLIKIANVSCKSAMAVFYNEVFVRDNPSKQKAGMTHKDVISAYNAYKNNPAKAAELDKAVAIGQKWNRQARNMLKEEGQDVVPWKKGRKRPTGTEMLNWDLPSSLS